MTWAAVIGQHAGAPMRKESARDFSIYLVLHMHSAQIITESRASGTVLAAMCAPCV
jgi:hypothetical protein